MDDQSKTHHPVNKASGQSGENVVAQTPQSNSAADITDSSSSVSQAPTPVAAQPQPSGQPDDQDWMPQIADDSDLIEKEWVDKAKEVVARTAHDPYLKNKELNKVKTEYLKKRYSKDLKQSD